MHIHLQEPTLLALISEFKVRKTMKISFRYIMLAISLVLFTGCENPLQEKTYTTLSPQDYFKTASDAERALNSVYGELRYSQMKRDVVTLQEVCTDIHIERFGGIFTFTEPIEEFVWDPSHQWLQNFWEQRYRGIYNANLVIENVPQINMNDARKEEMLAEARFLRAFSYFQLYDYFGPVPLLLTSETRVDDRPTRATNDEIVAFIEDELLVVSQLLSVNPPLDQYGRPTRGSALGVLSKFYLMNKKWQEAASTTQDVIDLGVYDLFVEGNRTELFNPENEGDNEFIFTIINSNNPNGDTGDGWLSHVAPVGYQWQYPPRAIFAAEFRIRSEFLELFKPEDERLDAFIFEYVNTDGELIELGEDNVRSFKYPEHPTQAGNRDGTDFPLVRYADILLSRAEALNELNGPNEESIQLINMVREAAGANAIYITDFSTKEGLRDFILDERGREFHTEGLRRQDLIRHGKFIKMARDRGKPAEDYHVRYPLPQSEINRNSNLVQNEGY